MVTTTDFILVGSLAGTPWILQLGFLNALPMLLERKIEYTYLSWSDIFLSIPFFAHQNRLTSSLFGATMQTQKGAYLPSGRGVGHTHTALMDIFIHFAGTNFIAGMQLLVMVIYFCCLGVPCDSCADRFECSPPSPPSFLQATAGRVPPRWRDTGGVQGSHRGHLGTTWCRV